MSEGREAAEAELRAVDGRYCSLFENMLEGLAHCRVVYENGRPQDFVYLDVNARFEALTGLRDVVGKRVSEVIPDFRQSSPEVFETYARVAATGEPERFEAYVEPMDDWFCVSVYSPEKGSFVAVFDVITQRKRAEETREATIELLRVCNRVGSVRELTRELTRSFQQLTGCEAVGVRLRDGGDFPYYETRGFPALFVQAENSLCTMGPAGEVLRDSVGCPVLDCMCGNILCGRFDPAKPFFTANGSFWSNCTTELLASTTEAERQARTRNRCNGEGYESVALIPLRMQDGIFGLFQFNDRRKGRFTAEKIAWLEELVAYVAIALAKLRTDEALDLKSFTIDNLAEEVFWIMPDGRIWNANEVACGNLGYTREELLSLSIPDIDPVFSKEAWQPHWEELKRSGSLYFESLHTTKDGRVYPVQIVANYFDHNGLEYNCAIVRDITERKNLEKALKMSEEQFRTLCDFAPIGIFRADGKGNNTYMNPRWEEIMEMPAREGLGRGWIEAVHPDDRVGILAVWLEAIATKGPYSHECRLLTLQGKTKWIRALGNFMADSAGNVTDYVGTVEDITELQMARQEMLKTQKLESLGLLAGGIAHDFNNILTAILGNISLARLQQHDPGKVRLRLEEAEKATARAKDLTQQLLTFARGGEPIKKVVNLGDVVREAAGFAVHGTAVRCEFMIADDLWPVEADEGQLSQVFHNLVLNAVQAMPNGGTITIDAGNASSLKGRRFVKISVTDTGVGIAGQDLQRIFDPYFTTKQQGSGLGLATCHSIVRKHGGKMRALSTLGRGSTFSVSLPALERDLEPEPLVRPAVSKGRGRVLVMDDEEAVREIVQTMLEELGYAAECVPDGAAAVDLYRTRREEGMPFSVVIMDLTIPGGMGGKEAIGLFLAMDPGVKVIASSGYSTDPVMANYREYGFSAVLSKPYKMQHISGLLAELTARSA